MSPYLPPYGLEVPGASAKDDPKESSFEVLRLFRIIFKSTTQHFAEVEKAAGIGGASLWALTEMAEIDDLTVSGLAKAMSIHQSTASNLLERLETGGYVARIRSTNDRRVVNLSLTEKGRDVLVKAPPPYRGLLLDALTRLDPKSLEQLKRDLSGLVDAMANKLEQSAFEPLSRS
jgi:MarR family transcriptional regulator, organic hydroperoxide resistance regulator